jgi:hypothetical protein
MHRIYQTLFLLFLLVSVPVASFGQAATGELSITVTDPSGAIVKDAEVTITGTDTGAVVRVLKTNDRGIAEVPLLQPGRYNTHIASAGFKTIDRNGVNVSVGSVISLDLALSLGESTDVVTVTGDAPLIEDKSETIAQVISSKEVTDIPLNGRNYLEAANFVPGAIPTSAGRDNTFSAYGNTGLQNAFLLDGARNVNYLRGLDNLARDMIRPPLDALREFTVQTSNFSAEYGAAAGGVVNAITKSGSNKFHGSAYDFFRNDDLDAQNYFASTRPLLVKNQYGGSIGGPVLKDKLFFFAAYEGVHQRDETPSTATVPTALERTGDFSQTKNAAGVVVPIYDPSTTVGTGTTATRAQFSGNRIAPSQLNAIGLALAQYYPLPNAPALGVNIYKRNAPERIDSKNGIARGDYQVSQKDSVFVRYAHTITSTANEAALPSPAANPGVATVTSKGIGAGYTRILTNSLINEFRFSWATTGIVSGGTQARNEVIPGSLDLAVNTGTPVFNVSNLTGLGGQAGCCGNSPLAKTSGVFDYADNISWSRGRHQFKLGGEFLWIRPKTFATSNGRSTFGFTGVFTQNPQARGTSGNALADLLLGDSNSLTTGTVAQNEERGTAYGLYAADQWQVTDALTVNYGLRYEFSAPFTEVQNRMGNFILDPGPLYGQLIFSGNPLLPHGLIYSDKNNIAPRLGLAYRVPGVKDMTVRSSYGIFYAQDEGTGVTNRMTSNPPFFGYGATTISSDQLNPATGFVLSPSASIAHPSPIPVSSYTLVPSATATLVSWREHFETSYVQQWSLSVQKQLPWAVLFEVNYVGNHGSQLLGLGQGNQPTVLNTTTVNSRRPLAAFTIAPVKTVGNWNSSQYEGLSAKIEKRFHKGYSFLNSFTYGHAFDLQNPALDLCDTCGAGDTLQDNYNRPANYASSDNDVRFRYVLTGIAELPFGKGKAFLNHNAVVSAIVGGWAASPVYQYQTGLPFTPAMSFDAANAGTLTRPTQLCNGNVGGAGTTQQWFNTACYANTASFVFGNAGRNILRAPGRNQLNLSLQRNFPLHFSEESNLNMRLEGFNLLNHPQFKVPGSTLGTSLYGVISSADAPRQVQIAARITF